MSFDLKKSIEEQIPHPASKDDLDVWAAQVWAMPENDLRVLIAGFEEVQADESRTPAERQAAPHLIDALEYALRDEMPPVETMRAAGLAIAAIRETP